jgi:protease-4
MKKFLIGLVCGFVLAGLAVVITAFAVARLGDRTPTIAERSTLMLKLSGPVPEIAPMEIPLPWFESQSPLTVIEVWDLLRKAEHDRRIAAVAFEPARVQAGWAKLQEIRDSLMRFKKSGKPLVAFLRNPNARDYYLASAADQIYMTPEDLLDLKGMRAELMYLRGGMDKLGLAMEVEHAGRYKDAADSFTRNSPSPETREVMNAVLDQIYGHLVESIATSRKMTADQVRGTIDKGPFMSKQARAAGLVDDLLFEDGYLDALRKRLKQEQLSKVSHRQYARIPASSLGLAGRTRIAFIAGQGTILRGGSDGLFGEENENIFSSSFSRMIRKVADDESIRGAIVRVDSPGGDAFASEEILHEIRRLSTKKPVVISMSDVAASGGYYISMTGDPVLAYPNTITGSIGVIYGKLNMRGLYEKLGINVELITRGKYADIDSSSRPLSPEGRLKLKEGVDETYRAFLHRVAEGRKKKVDEIAPLAEGRVWMGAQAKGKGLLDELGGIDRAIGLVKERAKIPVGEQVRLVFYPSKKGLFEQLFSTTPDAVMELRLRSRLRELMDGWNFEPLIQGGILRLMPYSIRVE